ncbi:hypothetical protein O4G76_06990 [Limimaricola sp. G21655-S1]|uniref:hypothetical protein n=1 Tax=Limimaricola sp. G21655-S1 TaxID=3014768 RepID=UPI0022AF0A9B|nr:hypothetical protein [Limimaricola sp. G21655-S1]MCZ4260586.1 hypothetical protein [Limimaricola sp. G21655-S1]
MLTGRLRIDEAAPADVYRKTKIFEARRAAEVEAKARDGKAGRVARLKRILHRRG